MSTVEPKCSGPFSDVRYCPVHGPEVYAREAELQNLARELAVALQERAHTERQYGCGCDYCRLLARARAAGLLEEGRQEVWAVSAGRWR